MRATVMTASYALIGAVVAAILTSCSGEPSGTDLAEQLDNAATADDHGAFADLLAKPVDPEDAADLDAAIANLPALIDPEFTVRDDGQVLLNGEPFGTVSDDGVVVGHIEFMMLDDALGWSVDHATAGNLNEYALLSGGRYRLTDADTQDWFVPVVDGATHSEGSLVVTATGKSAHVAWEPTRVGTDAAAEVARQAFADCESGCTTPERIEVTTTAPIPADGIAMEPDHDGRTQITATLGEVPVTYDPPITAAEDITEGTATLTTTVELVEGEMVAADVKVDLE